MHQIYCIMFNFSLNDDVRDVLFQTAYLMLKSGQAKRKVRSEFCEGVVTQLGSIAFCGSSGIEFGAQLETEEGDLKVSYMVRPQDLHLLEDAEYGAWLSPEEAFSHEYFESRRRPNPIRKVAKSCRNN